jgi:uncharacterized protein YbdZ (MbtH family)
MNNQELLEEYHEAARSLSFYHAGWDYPETARQEKAACDAAHERWEKVKKELWRRGIEIPAGYLVSRDIPKSWEE